MNYSNKSLFIRSYDVHESMLQYRLFSRRSNLIMMKLMPKVGFPQNLFPEKNSIIYYPFFS